MEVRKKMENEGNTRISDEEKDKAKIVKTQRKIMRHRNGEWKR
jgi:hypothetical protein